MLFSPLEWALNAILVNQPSGFYQLGLFNAARQWYIVIMFVPGVIQQITMPLLSNLWGEGKVAQYRRFLLWQTIFFGAISVAVALPVAVGSKLAMSLYGPGFSAGAWILVLTCARALSAGPNMVVGQALWSTGSSWTALLLAGVRSVLLLGFFLMLMRWQALGLAGAFAASDFALLVIQSWYMRWKTNVGPVQREAETVLVPGRS
jgi:O-antigen/teichoic acid export membrane protein